MTNFSKHRVRKLEDSGSQAPEMVHSFDVDGLYGLGVSRR